MIVVASFIDFFQSCINLNAFLHCFPSTFFDKRAYIMLKNHVEIISLFFHHTSFFAMYSTNSVTLGVARKKRMTREKLVYCASKCPCCAISQVAKNYQSSLGHVYWILTDCYSSNTKVVIHTVEDWLFSLQPISESALFISFSNGTNHVDSALMDLLNLKWY